MIKNHSNYLSPESIISSWREAKSRNFYSKTEWKRRGKEVINLDPDGILVLKTSKVSHPIWRPVLKADGEFFIVAEDWFDLYSEALVLGEESSGFDFLSKNLDQVEFGSSKTPLTEISFKDFECELRSIQASIEREEGGGEGVHNDGQSLEKTPQVIDEPETCVLNNCTDKSKRPSPNWSPKEFDFEAIQNPEVRDTLLRFSNLIYLKGQDYSTGLETFVNLKKSYLRENFGKSQIEEALRIGLETGLIETNPYIVGEKSIGYRFGERFREGQFKIRNVFLSPKEEKKLKELLRRNPHLRYLHTHLQTITIDQKLLSQVDPNSELWESLQTINSKIWFFGKDDFSGRIHHNLSNLKKEGRALLRVNNGADSLWEVDIANSQPLFAALAAQNKGFEDARFLSLCQEGALYEVLGASWGLAREAAKTETFKIFFSKNGYRSERKAIFETFFPTFSLFMRKAKSVKYQHFSELSQREERRTIIDSVVPEFIKKARGSFISTIHDSLLVRKQQVELVRGILECEFLERFGLKPKLHVKDTKRN